MCSSLIEAVESVVEEVDCIMCNRRALVLLKLLNS